MARCNRLGLGGITTNKNDEQRVVPKFWKDQLATLLCGVPTEKVGLDVEDRSDGRPIRWKLNSNERQSGFLRLFYFRYGSNINCETRFSDASIPQRAYSAVPVR